MQGGSDGSTGGRRPSGFFHQPHGFAYWHPKNHPVQSKSKRAIASEAGKEGQSASSNRMGTKQPVCWFHPFSNRGPAAPIKILPSSVVWIARAGARSTLHVAPRRTLQRPAGHAHRLAAGRPFSAAPRPKQLHFPSPRSKCAGRSLVGCGWGGGVAYRRFGERGVAFRRVPKLGTAKLLGNRHRLPPWLSAICFPGSPG